MWKKKLKHISKRKLLKRLLLIMTLLGVMVAATFTLFIQPLLEEDTYVYKESSVEYGDLVSGIMESGSVVASLVVQEYDLDLTINSDEEDDNDEEEETTEKYLKIEEMYAAIGQRVAKGDPLFKLTEDSIKDVRRLLETQKNEAQIALEEAELAYNLEALTAKHDYLQSTTSGTTAEGKYANSVAKLNNEINGLSGKIEVAKSTISLEEVELDDIFTSQDYTDNNKNYKVAKAAYENGSTNNYGAYVTLQTEYLSAKNKYDTMCSQIAQLQLSIATEKEKIEDYLAQIESLKNQLALETMEERQTYETSKLTSDIASSQYDYTVGSLEETLEEAKATLEDATSQLDAFEKFVGDGIVITEYAGLIMELNYSVDDSLITAGTIASYVTDGALTLTVDVSQEDIADVAIGDNVSIDFTAYPDVIYEGEVTAITTTSTSSTAATVSYPVTIKILGDTLPIFEGMPGNVTFVTEEKKDVLFVSKKAIVEQDNKTYIYTKNTLGNMELREVTTGFSNGTNIEITEGLQEGDTIFIASKVSNEGVAK